MSESDEDMLEKPDVSLCASLTKEWGHPFAKTCRIMMRKDTRDYQTGLPSTKWECWPYGTGRAQSFFNLEDLDADIAHRQKAREFFAKVMAEEEHETLVVRVERREG